jgi:hypothetical protein
MPLSFSARWIAIAAGCLAASSAPRALAQDRAQDRLTTSLAGVADLRVWGPAALRAGFTFLPRGQDRSFQPHFGLRVQLLRQTEHRVDGAIAVTYRMDRFTEDEGLIQVAVLVGRRFGDLGLIANLAYGQDPEGDDRDGELRLAALYALGSVQVGVDGRARFDLFSTDARRASRGEGALDFAAGPLASLSLGRFALIAQAGVSGVRVVTLRPGLLATMGVASVF